MGDATRDPSTAQANRDQLECVQGQIGFARRSPEEAAPEFRNDAISSVGHNVTIRNARQIVNELSLDREGFILVRQQTSCANECDPEVTRNRYLDEMVPFIKDYFNASWVVPKKDAVFIRRAGAPRSGRGDATSVAGVRVPAGLAHIDYMPIAGPMLAARENQVQGIPIRSYSRLMIVNTWRVISPPPQDFPLAVCDSSSVPDADIVVYDHTDAESDFTWKTGTPHYSPLHRWYYFPDMTPDELLLFKFYDSEQNYKVVHSAFDNRRAYPNAKPRESIEARFYVYYD